MIDLVSGSGGELVSALAGRYVIERVLGRGGMGMVLAARHSLLNQTVAIKLLLPEIAQIEEYRRRFIREAKAGALLDNEHVVRVHDVATLESGQPYIVMEHLEGCNLASLLARRQRLPFEEAVDYVLEALEAVAAAHLHHIIHRDLKPSNLFLAKRRDGSQILKVLDFGISKVAGGDGSVTTTNAMLGTPSYVSPEQARSTKRVDSRTDLWAMGVVLYELVAGRRPFRGDNVGQIIASVLEHDPAPLDAIAPGTPPGLAEVVKRCLERDVRKRYASARELAYALAPFGSTRALASAERIEAMSTSGAAKPSEDATLDAVVSVSVRAAGPKRVRSRMLAGIGGAVLAFAATAALGIATRAEARSGTVHAAAPSVGATVTTDARGPVTATTLPPELAAAVASAAPPPAVVSAPARAPLKARAAKPSSASPPSPPSPSRPAGNAAPAPMSSTRE